jgi:hypothetical protein
MTINQLFKKKPSKELVEKLINTFGLMGFNDDSFFSKKETDKNNTISKINNLVPILDEYYLPCKKKIYLRDINYKRSITILRQCIKVYNFVLKSKEKYIKGDKLIIYQIVPVDEKPKEKKEISNCIISFD